MKTVTPETYIRAESDRQSGVFAKMAGGNFDDPKVLVMCVVGALLMLVSLMITTGELGKRVPVDDNR